MSTYAKKSADPLQNFWIQLFCYKQAAIENIGINYFWATLPSKPFIAHGVSQVQSGKICFLPRLTLQSQWACILEY
jgi:hypothetical protein